MTPWRRFLQQDMDVAAPFQESLREMSATISPEGEIHEG